MEPKCRDSETEARRLVNNSGFIGPSLQADHRWQGQAGRHIHQSELPDELVTGLPLLSTDDAERNGEQSGESSRHKHSEGEAGDLRQADASLAEGHKQRVGTYQGNDSSGYGVKCCYRGLTNAGKVAALLSWRQVRSD